MIKRRAEAYWVEKTKRWQINVQRDGRRKTFNSPITGRQGKHECESKADKWLASQESQQRFQAASEMYLEWKKEHVVESTYSGVKSDIQYYIAPVIGNKWLHTISQFDWQSCLDKMARKGNSEGYLKRVAGTITNFCEYCHSRMWEVTSPKSLDTSGGRKTRARRALYIDEIRALLNATEADGHYIYMFQFLMFTGMRRGECVGLEHGDIDVAAREVRVRAPINARKKATDGKTENALRIVGLPMVALDVLELQKKMLARKGIISRYVFPSVKSSCATPTYVTHTWRKFADEHNIGCTLHELRNTYISMVKTDMPLALLKKTVGHSVNMDTIKVYASYMEGDGEIAATAADKSISKIIDLVEHGKTGANASADKTS